MGGVGYRKGSINRCRITSLSWSCLTPLGLTGLLSCQCFVQSDCSGQSVKINSFGFELAPSTLGGGPGNKGSGKPMIQKGEGGGNLCTSKSRTAGGLRAAALHPACLAAVARGEARAGPLSRLHGTTEGGQGLGAASPPLGGVVGIHLQQDAAGEAKG